VANRVLNRDLVENGPIVQLDGDGVSDGPPLRVMVIGRVGSILDASDLSAESINSRVSGSGVSAAEGSAIGEDRGGRRYVLGLRIQLSENERIGNHVVDVMAICAGFVS
jgi:hypothetical protein